jgi:multicomponent Na+:H+ antiporter subunit B
MSLPFGSSVLDTAARLLTPFIMLFAAYVVAHGHYGPGGGFQGGVILAAALILVRLVRGDATEWGLTPARALYLACTGVLFYASIGFLSFLGAGRYLDYGALPLDLEPVRLHAIGSYSIEVGVAMGVVGVMVLIFDALVAWDERD